MTIGLELNAKAYGLDYVSIRTNGIPSTVAYYSLDEGILSFKRTKNDNSADDIAFVSV